MVNENKSYMDDAELAAEVEEEALQEDTPDIYIRTLKKPFTYEGHTYESLTFDWSVLTGNDFAAVENEMMARGKTLVIAEYSGDFLIGIAARACSERGERGEHIVTAKTLCALPIGDYSSILKRARSFLLRAGY